MGDRVKFTKDDVIYFLDMIKSVHSPNFEPGMHKRKPYYELFKNKNSDDYRRFIGVYRATRYVLPEREQLVLNEIYGVDTECSKLKTVGSILGVSIERVKQIRSYGENKIARELRDIFLKD